MRRVNKGERARLTLTLNGRKVSGEAEPRMLLSDFLRHVLGATGTHVGCEHGVCGCCAVLIDGVAARACLTLAVQAEGRAITTVEALAGPDVALNALQQIDATAQHYPHASMLVGMIFLKRGQLGLAQEKFSKVVAGRAVQRATLEPHYFLALCHERAGEKDKARAIFEKILAEDYNFRDVKARLAAMP